METQVQQPTSLSDLAPTRDKKVSESVVLASPHFYGIVARALSDRSSTLTKLAKDARSEGFERQAREIDADAAAIESVLLPQFRMQRELPLVDGEKFEKAVGDALAGMVRAAFAGLDDPKTTKITKDMIARRRDSLTRDLGARVATFAREIADAAKTHGYHLRTTTADVIAAGQLRTLSGSARVD